MLGMKTLKAVVAALGCALLFGAGVAAAQQPVNIAVARNAPGLGAGPVAVALETNPSSRALMVGDADLVTTTRVLLAGADDYFLRVALDGATFTSNPSLTGAGTSAVMEGGTGKNQAVFRLGTTDVAINGTLTMPLDNALTANNTNVGNITATTSLHTDQFHAINGTNAISTVFAGGTTTIVRKIQGVGVRVRPGTPAVADVSTEPVGFLWFVNQAGSRHSGSSASADNLSSVKLGNAFAVPAAQDMVDASDGMLALHTDLFTSSGFSITVEGDLSIGAFDLVRQQHSSGMTTVPCPDQKSGKSAASPGVGNVGPRPSTDTTPRSHTVNFAPGANNMNPSLLEITTPTHLCLEVDNAGADSNRRPIQAQKFMGTVSVTLPQPGREPRVAKGIIGEIKRNGTTVNLAYLTVSEKYNQRLIIINRGPTPVLYNFDSFTVEPGSNVRVGLSDAAMARQNSGENMVPRGGQLVMRVADLLKFTGTGAVRRAGVTLSLNAAYANVQVATTQVNLQDGSTDTTVYPSQNEIAAAMRMMDGGEDGANVTPVIPCTTPAIPGSAAGPRGIPPAMAAVPAGPAGCTL